MFIIFCFVGSKIKDYYKEEQWKKEERTSSEIELKDSRSGLNKLHARDECARDEVFACTKLCARKSIKAPKVVLGCYLR